MARIDRLIYEGKLSREIWHTIFESGWDWTIDNKVIKIDKIFDEIYDHGNSKNIRITIEVLE